MSHQPERKEKDCLNCGTLVQGRFCHVCGQENIETKESFFSLLKHFIFDILHFDSKFFETLKDLLFRPGYLSKQYVAGKRMSFLNPIRMYLFTSALFFLVFFSLKDPTENFGDLDASYNDTLSKRGRDNALTEIKEALKEKPGDTALLRKLGLVQDSTRPVYEKDAELDKAALFVGDKNTKYSNLQEYDSTQKALPATQKDGWLKHLFIRKALALNVKYSDNPKEGLQHFLEIFLHKLPYLLFLSLPFFALILKLLYVRRKAFYYSDHAIFTLHHYIFSFILLILIFLFGSLSDWTHYGIFKIPITLLLLSWPFYLFLALRRFYGQGLLKTFSKFLLLNLLGIIVLLLLFTVFLFFTLLQL
ncbi:MAG TPA: DUF3667 domain-containing protein [Chitinophagaceae bacterium]|nr:DUF3667 domain-containing protein [Chitinophagaceae bacterium]